MRPFDRLATAAVLALAFAVPARAQTQGSALPAPPADMRALEARLSTILDNATQRQVVRFQLPSGATVLVRAYITVDRHTGRPCRVCRTPCRGYRIDYVAPPDGAMTAVEGFRCRAPGGSWPILQPETVIARSGPRGPLPQGVPPEALDEGPGDVAFGDEASAQPRFAETPFEDVPIPRPAPPRPHRAAADGARRAPAAEGERPGAVEAAREALARAERGESPATADSAGREETPTAREAPREEATSPAIATPTDGHSQAERAAAAPDAGEASQAALPPPPPPARPTPEEVARAGEAAPVEPGTRVIYPGPGEQTPATASGGEEQPSVTAPIDDPGIIEALRDLRYLDPDAEPSEEEIAAAVDEFAVDEGFALPVAPEELAERLRAARERTADLAACKAGSQDATICLDEQ